MGAALAVPVVRLLDVPTLQVPGEDADETGVQLPDEPHDGPERDEALPRARSSATEGTRRGTPD